MNKEEQLKTPFFTKLKEFSECTPTPFDFPGHKLGRMKTDLLDYIGEKVFKMDCNAPIGLDNLGKPTGVIKEAQQLMADSCNADEAFFLVNGTTIGILAMIMSSVSENEKIILPRNVHKSVINAIILSGAIPIFVEPDFDMKFNIACGVTLENVKRKIDLNPDAKAILLINPTYLGITSDIKSITKIAHQNHMLVLVDEAHGAQFYYNKMLPDTAMDAEADISSVSYHKTAGSFTQSSVLLVKGRRVNKNRVRASINMLQSTSPSPLLIASLDTARKTMYFEGTSRLEYLLKSAKIARYNLQQISGLNVMDRRHIEKTGKYNFDETKLLIDISNFAFSGIEIYNKLRSEYQIQVELAEKNNILCILSSYTTDLDISNLIIAFTEFSKHKKTNNDQLKVKLYEYCVPELCISPRMAYNSSKHIIPIETASEKICAESIMIYPPGIPLIIPGEKITKTIIDDIQFYKESGHTVMGESNNGGLLVVI